MDCVSVIKDSIQTSISLKLFKNIEESSFAHIFKSKLVKLPLSLFNNVENFNPDRLQKSATKAYPLNNRPRGSNDVNSVKFYQKKIQQKKDIPSIWMINKDKKYILLDGAHRIVSHFIEDKIFIYSYVISL